MTNEVVLGPENNNDEQKEVTRRDFVVLTASAVAAVGAVSFAWPLIDSMNPSSDVLALSSIEVDLSPISVGQEITVMWRGMPVFIRHRTAKEIEEAKEVVVSSLRDPQTDEQRVKKGREQWLVVIGICTHLGCVPTDYQGQFGGWLCHCHGSQYDTSGRIRLGPAPLNLAVPEYNFVTDSKIKIG